MLPLMLASSPINFPSQSLVCLLQYTNLMGQLFHIHFGTNF